MTRDELIEVFEKAKNCYISADEHCQINGCEECCFNVDLDDLTVEELDIVIDALRNIK